MKLICGYQLAAQLGVSPQYVALMKKAGCPFRGRKTSMLWARKWLEANPWFKMTAVLSPRDRRKVVSPLFTDDEFDEVQNV